MPIEPGFVFLFDEFVDVPDISLTLASVAETVASVVGLAVRNAAALSVCVYSEPSSYGSIILLM